MEDCWTHIAKLRIRADDLRIEFAAIKFEHEAGRLTRDEWIVLSRPIISDMRLVATEMRALVPARSDLSL